MKTARVLLAVLMLCRAGGASYAEESADDIQCRKSGAFLTATDASDYRKYAPSRQIDILHVALDVTPDFTNRTVAGKTTISFKPIAKPLDELSLDAVDLTVNSVTSSEPILDYQVMDEKIIVTFTRPVPADKEAWVAIEHRAEPTQGMYFRTPEMGYKPGDTHLFTQGEPIEARHWYPCFDSPNEKFTSEITCRVPEGMTVLSNGRLVSEEKDPTTGLVAVKWLQDKPHANYLVSLVAGYFKKVEDKHRSVPLAFYTPASEINEAANSFQDTKDIMAFYEEEIGVPFPWAKYYQVAVNDFVAGGMENTTLTTLTDNTLFTTNTENIRSSQSLVAHEMAHQWFGDLVTCKDWSHIWLNEGFATYYAHLYDEHRNGRDSMLYHLYNDAQRILGITNSARPIVDRKYDDPMDLFGYLAYEKGGWVLHMLRSELGKDLYRRCIKTYLERHRFGSVVTEDLNAVIEELSGRSYDQFFDQWVYHGGQPELDVNYSWDARSKLAKVSVRQIQKISDDSFLFHFPLILRFKTKSSSVDKQVTVKEKSEDYYFALDEAPVTVRIDPEYALLAKINFTPPTPMLYEQLQDQTDVVGRLLAIEALGKRKDQETVGKLKGTLNQDIFYGVRIESANALRNIHTDEALDVLLGSTRQPDARVRRQVYVDIAGFYGLRSSDAERGMLAVEKNPDILTAGIRDLGAYAQPGTRELLMQYLNSTSYRNGLAVAAIAALRGQDDPSGIEPLRDNLKKREADYTSAGFGQGLNALAYLARDEKDKTGVREFLLGYMNHRKETIQLAAINALGALGDAGALPALGKFARIRKASPQQQAAARAMESIESFRKATEGLAGLRKEFLDLQKENQELRKDFDSLQKKVSALGAPAGATKKSSIPIKSPKDKATR
jgi:aminopeptidase N